MTKLARVAVTMLGWSAVLTMAAALAGHPWWMLVLPKLLLLGGVINMIVATALTVSRETEHRAELRDGIREMEGRRDAARPVGTCPVHGTVWAGGGSGSVFRAFADHGECAYRSLPGKPVIAGACPEHGTAYPEPFRVPGEVFAPWRGACCLGLVRGSTTIIRRDGMIAGYLRLAGSASSGLLTAHDYYLVYGVSLIGALVTETDLATIQAAPAERWEMPGGKAVTVTPVVVSDSMSRPVVKAAWNPAESMTGPRDTQLMVAMISPGPAFTHEEASLTALAEGIGRLGAAVRAAMTRMPHGPECDCVNCD